MPERPMTEDERGTMGVAFENDSECPQSEHSFARGWIAGRSYRPQTNPEPSEAEVEAAAKALHERDQLAHDEWEEAEEEHRQWVRGEAKAALTAARGQETPDE